MEIKEKNKVVNLLISGLAETDRKVVLDHCEIVDLKFGDILCEPDVHLLHVHFPITGFVSLVTTLANHKPLEMGLIGNEGMLGATLILGIDMVPLRAIVQGSGTALRMSVPDLRRSIRKSSSMRHVMNEYLYVLIAQLSKIAACTHFHEVELRLARWLLMTHDRAHADHFALTHQFLADMLGVQRSAVTIAAGTLQQQKLIRYTRGKIRILDRKGLEAASCECYGAVVEDYARLIQPREA